MRSLASFLVLLIPFRTLEAECISSTPPHGITNTKTIYETNENVSYSCQNGYILIGNRRVICLDNGDWSHPPPHCVENWLHRKTIEVMQSKSVKPAASTKLFQLLTDGIWTSCFDIAQNGTIFSVQLADRVKVSAIRLVFQNHQHFQRMNVFVDEQTCHYNGQLPETGALELHCTQQPMGSRLRIQIWSLQFPLAICEVQAFSTESENKLCGTPVPPLNGFIRDGAADEFRFSCHSNFDLAGSEVTRCVDGRWTHETPKCVYRLNDSACTALPHLENGIVHYSQSPVNDQYSHSTKAKYICLSNYLLIGNQVRTCTDGSWTGPHSICVDPKQPTASSGSEMWVIAFAILVVLVACIYLYIRKCHNRRGNESELLEY